MSFICERCGKKGELGEQPVLVVTKIRNFTHPIRYDRQWNVIDPGGRGTQIVQETMLHSGCARGVVPGGIVV